MTSAATSAPAAAPARATAYAVCMADLQADRSTVQDLWRTYSQLPPEAKFEWFYQRHPCGTPTLLMLTHGPQAEPVGVASLGTRRVSVQGVDGSAGILADLVVLPEHRTLYPALLLQKQMQRTALGLHSIVYGIPNKNSTPIVRRLGYTKVGELIRYSNVLRSSTYLERSLPRWLSKVLGAVADRVIPLYFKPYRVLSGAWEGTWVDAVDARFDALWERARAYNGLIGTRDAQFLSWRFLTQPGHQYRTFVVARPGGSDITAYAVCEADGHTLHIRDFLADPSRDDHVRLLIHLLSRQAYAQGFANLSMEFMGSRHLHGILVGAGMVERDKRALYACFGPQDEARLRQLDWYVTSADEDQ